MGISSGIKNNTDAQVSSQAYWIQALEEWTLQSPTSESDSQPGEEEIIKSPWP